MLRCISSKITSPLVGRFKPNIVFIKLDLPQPLSPTQAISRGAAEAARSADVVRGTGTLDVLRYGRVLKARSLVGVRGAGEAFDGLHYVTSVKHRIRRGEYLQDFELTRNALISNLPVVPS